MVNILVANDKGGVGKSTIAQYCITRLRQSGHEVRIVDIDRQPKLHRFFGAGAVTSLPFDSVDPNSNTIKWDMTVGWFQRSRPMVMDFGAQVWADFKNWASEVDLHQFFLNSRLVILVPVTADVEAMRGARVCVTEARALFADATIAVLFCDKDGDIKGLSEIPEFKALVGAIRDAEAIPKGISVMNRDSYATIAGHGVSFARIEEIDSGDLAAVAGLVKGAPVSIVRSIKAVRAWLQQVDTQLLDLIRPSQAPASSPRPVVSTVASSAAPPEQAPSPTPVQTQAPVPDPVATPPVIEASIRPANFNEANYLTLNPDVASAIRNGEFASGFDHYSRFGHLEGRKF